MDFGKFGRVSPGSATVPWRIWNGTGSKPTTRNACNMCVRVPAPNRLHRPRRRRSIAVTFTTGASIRSDRLLPTGDDPGPPGLTVCMRESGKKPRASEPEQIAPERAAESRHPFMGGTAGGGRPCGSGRKSPAGWCRFAGRFRAGSWRHPPSIRRLSGRR